MSSDRKQFTGSGGVAEKRRIGPALALLVLSPIIGEVLSGATRLSYSFALAPEIMVWGCGTLMIRELAWRWRAGWTSVLLLGFAFSIAEEFIIQQTSIAPLPWLGTTPAYGRVWGVNWPYFLFMLGYEAVWIVLVPIQMTELIFPERRDQCWLRARGLIMAMVVFLSGCFIAWFLWTQRARPLVFHVPAYHPPAITVLIGVFAILALSAIAYLARNVWCTGVPGTPPRPWLAALLAVLLGLPWYLLLVVTFDPKESLPLAVPLLGAAAWAAGVFSLVKRWSRTSGWTEMHRWALCFGAMLVCMTGGFLGASAWPLMDIVAKGVFNLIAVAWMIRLAFRLAKGLQQSRMRVVEGA
jgi:hypothetical protein